MWMNEGEIDEMLDFVRDEAPDFLRYAQYLSDWRDVVNQNFDGWPYWKAGGAAASRLTHALMALKAAKQFGNVEAPEEIDFRKGLSAIKACATRFSLSAPELQPVSNEMRL